MTNQIALVLGGASSGKSAWAEQLVATTAAPRVYVATAQAYDPEMDLKIAEHRRLRGDGWETVEAPHFLADTLRALPPGRRILLDCATMWLSNRLLAEADLREECKDLVAALAACASPVVVVSNEVGLGIVPDNALARRFRDAQGRLNRQIAERAGLVVAVMAGLPMVLKGQIPEDMQW